MARIRITLEDDDGREIKGDKERLYDLSLETKRLVDIEAAVETLKQAALPELTAELLTLAQQQFVAEVKKGASCAVMGRGASRSRPCTGPFAFVVQRFQCPSSGETTYLELTAQLCEGAMSARLAEFSAYYSNRMSYDEVAGLLERVTGQPWLSDQTIQHPVVTKAVEVSRQWQSEGQATTTVPPLPAVRPQVDWYDPQSEEVLLLTDAIQVKQQKASRGHGADKPTGERETKRVHTDVWLVEQPTGGFTYLTAGVDAMGQEVVSGTARVRWQLQQDYAARSEPLPVIAITDGARTIRRQLAELFGQPVPVILDWYHLDKKVGELMGMVARKGLVPFDAGRYVF
jgi:hypothetical protein